VDILIVEVLDSTIEGIQGMHQVQVGNRVAVAGRRPEVLEGSRVVAEHIPVVEEGIPVVVEGIPAAVEGSLLAVVQSLVVEGMHPVEGIHLEEGIHQVLEHCSQVQGEELAPWDIQDRMPQGVSDPYDARELQGCNKHLQDSQAFQDIFPFWPSFSASFLPFSPSSCIRRPMKMMTMSYCCYCSCVCV